MQYTFYLYIFKEKEWKEKTQTKDSLLQSIDFTILYIMGTRRVC